MIGSASEVAPDPGGRIRAGKRPRRRLSRGRSDGKRPGPATAGGGYFPPPVSINAASPNLHHSGFASPDKIAAARRPPLRSGRSAVQARSARRQVIAVKAAHAGASQEGASP